MRQRFRWSEERTRALEDIRLNGRASTRQLAKRWGWTQAKVHRFLAFVDAHPESVNRFTDSVKADSVKAKPIHPDSVKHAPLDKNLLDKLHLEAGSGYTFDLISEMNRCLTSRFGSDYKPVLHDNDSSVETGRELQVAGVDLGWALMTLRCHAMRFNREKAGGGKLPGSLKYWKRGLLRDWGLRAQSEIPLLTIESPLSGVHNFRSVEDQKPRRPEQVKQAVWTVLEGLMA